MTQCGINDHKKDHDIWCWKSMTFLEHSNKCLGIKPVNRIRLPLDNLISNGNIYTPNTQIHDRLLSWLGTGTSIEKSGGVKIVCLGPTLLS